MDNIFEGVFSEYTVTGVAFKPEEANEYTLVDGAGSVSEEYERKTITKAKSNVTVKKIARAAGSGTLTLNLHMPLDLYNKLNGLLKGEDADVVTGVYALPARTLIPKTEIAMEVEDEDGDKKFKYYPCANCASFNRSMTSEADTVAEVEMQFELSADEYKNIMYEALGDDLDTAGGSITSSNWMTSVSSAALQEDGGETGATGQTGATGATGTTGSAGAG